MDENMFFGGVLSDYQDDDLPVSAPVRPVTQSYNTPVSSQGVGAESFPYEETGPTGEEEITSAQPSPYDEGEGIVSGPILERPNRLTPRKPIPMQATSKDEFGYENKGESKFQERKGEMIDDRVDMMYEALAEAETGNEDDPYIRTKYRDAKGGSSAFGPVQITMKLAKGYKKKHGNIFDKDEKKFLDRFIKQGRQFLKHGNMKGKLKTFDPRFDYGGKGDLIQSEEDKTMYERVAKKMIAQHIKDADGDLEEATRTWRYGPDHKGKEDTRYWNIVGNKIGMPFAGR